MFKEEIIILPKTCHEPTHFCTDGDYTLSAHLHDGGVMVINSFEKKVVKSIDKQLKEVRLKYNI